jgi:hypothetical protein
MSLTPHRDKRLSSLSSSISAADSKRQRCELDNNEELKCSICFDLVVDAVQVRCCGALHCRACISKCATCPLCRKPLGAESIISDVRCERLSAAAIRQCSHAANGCTFKGNRASVTSHEALCDFVPPGVLRNEIQKLNEALLANSTNFDRMKAEKMKLRQELNEIQKLNEALLANSTNFERMKAEKMKLQQELMNCALGPEPAASAMRVLHHISADKAVFVIDRAAASGHSTWICSWFEGAFVPFHQKLTPQQYLQQIQQYQPQPSAADLDLVRRTLMVTVSVAIFTHASVMCY